MCLFVHRHCSRNKTTLAWQKRFAKWKENIKEIGQQFNKNADNIFSKYETHREKWRIIENLRMLQVENNQVKICANIKNRFWDSEMKDATKTLNGKNYQFS